MDKLTNPHDKYFRASMSDLRVAKSFLQAHLPETLVELIDWNTLHLAPNQHLNQYLSETVTDMLYQVKFGKAAGYISVLVEHQSSIDPQMPFRMLCYCVNIMRRYLKQNPRQPLPLVVPLVFYSGQLPYDAPTDVFALFGDLEPLARDIFLKPFQLIDVGRVEDEELRQHTWASVMELVQKHIWAQDFLPILKRLAPLLKSLAEQSGDEYIYGTLQYISYTADLADPNTFIRMINEDISSELGDKIMSLAQQWHQAGEHIGLEKGIEKGMEKGRQETQKVIARRLLGQGVDPEFIVKITEMDLSEMALLDE